MTIDIELTLNRWGFGWVAVNKLQLACVRLAWWKIPHKHSISFEVNWHLKPRRPHESLPADDD